MLPKFGKSQYVLIHFTMSIFFCDRRSEKFQFMKHNPTNKKGITLLWKTKARMCLPTDRLSPSMVNLFHLTTVCFCSCIVDPSRVYCNEDCVNGKCIGPDICQCNDGYTGSLCDEITCPGWCIYI